MVKGEEIAHKNLRIVSFLVIFALNKLVITQYKPRDYNQLRLGADR